MVKNLEITKGDTFFKNLIFKTNNGSAYNLTGATITMIVKKYHEDETAELETNATITDDTGGLAELTFSSAETKTLSLGNHYYDIQLKDSSGIVSTFLKGFLVITFEN